MAFAASTLEGISALLGAIGIGALGGSLLTAYFAARRERAAIRRSRLSDALTHLYGPVSTMLEVNHRFNNDVVDDLRGPESEEGRKLLMERNVATLDRVRQTLETQLHHADGPEFREVALAFLEGREVRELLMAIYAAEQPQAATVVVLPDKPIRKSPLHEMAAREFEAKSREFRTLSGDDRETP